MQRIIVISLKYCYMGPIGRHKPTWAILGRWLVYSTHSEYTVETEAKMFKMPNMGMCPYIGAIEKREQIKFSVHVR